MDMLFNYSTTVSLIDQINLIWCIIFLCDEMVLLEVAVIHTD